MPILGTPSALTFFLLFVLASLINGLLVGSPIQIASPIKLVSSSTQSATTVSTSQTSSLSLASSPQASSIPSLATTSQTSSLSLASSPITEQPTASSTASTDAPKASTASVKKLQDPYSGNGPISGNPVEDPSQDPGIPSNPGGPDPTVPQYLKSASELVAPSQATKEAQSAPQDPEAAKESSTTPQGSSSSDPEAETQATDTPQVNSPSEPQAETEAPETPQANVSSEPQAETEAPETSQANASSEPQAETQAPSTPQVDSTSEPQAGAKSPDTQAESASQSQAEPASQSQGETSAPGSASEGTDSSPVQAQAEASPVLTVGSSTYAYNLDSSSNLIIASQTVRPGAAAISIGGVKVALVPSTNSIVVADSTIPIQTPPPSANAQYVADNEVVASGATPQFTVGNEVVTPNSASQYVIAGQTLVPGASAVTIAGTPISIAPSAAQVVVGGSTIGLQAAYETTPPTIKINGQIITANSASQFVIGGQTITPAVTISGTPISIPATFQQTQPNSGIMTAGSKAYPYMLNSAGDIVLASQTLIPGGQAITVGGETISESSDGSGIVVVSGGSTRTESLSQIIGPTGSFRSNGSFTVPAFTGFNSSTTSRSGTAAGSAAITPTNAASAPPINPSSAITAGTRKDSGTSRSKISVNVMVALFVACIVWCR